MKLKTMASLALFCVIVVSPHLFKLFLAPNLHPFPSSSHNRLYIGRFQRRVDRHSPRRPYASCIVVIGRHFKWYIISKASSIVSKCVCLQATASTIPQWLLMSPPIGLSRSGVPLEMNHTREIVHGSSSWSLIPSHHSHLLVEKPYISPDWLWLASRSRFVAGHYEHQVYSLLWLSLLLFIKPYLVNIILPPRASWGPMFSFKPIQSRANPASTVSRVQDPSELIEA